MDTSIFLARLIGPIFAVIGVSLLLNREAYHAVAEEVLKGKALLYVFGAMALTGGLAIVLTHNVWVWGWPVIITLLGWLMVIRGSLRILLPEQVAALAVRTLARAPLLFPISGVVVIVLGAVLCWKGYA